MNYCEKFNELPWHDSALLNIEIDRSNPGESDTVRILIQWPDDSQSYVVFSECYFFEAKMNFGVIAEESILGADCNNYDEQILTVQSKWSPLGVGLDKLLCYKIYTNSTNSTLKIYALSMEVL